MTSWKQCIPSTPTFVWLAKLSRLWLLVFFSSHVHSLYPPITLADDAAPRAALVTLAYEYDLEPLLSSMHQLEQAFNSRYNYDWVFFSTVPLSEEFRRLTSNATTATCVYEVVGQGDVTLRSWEEKDPFSQEKPSQTSQEAASPTRGDTFKALKTFRQLQRWNNGPFAKEKRLQTYDWFWRIQPGAQFTHDIGFDIFRFMRDHNIAYGSNKVNLEPIHRSLISQQVKRFLDKHSDLLHAEADVAWLLGLSDDRYDRRGSLKWSRGFSTTGTTKDDASTPEEAFTNWLLTFYKSGTSPKFDIGSLSFFRSHSHQVLLDHLDGYDSQYEQGFGDILVPTISASMFLPQKSVWNFRQRDRGYTSWPHPPDSTPEPKLKLWHRMKRAVRNDSHQTVTKQRQSSSQDRRSGLTERFALWDVIAEDFGRQAAIPGLQSGNTVIDGRNFALS
ncbi:alpha-1,2 mannosyltransferase KTR1 [Metarhizium album ARSEF 1941]|uniref:Alpha-1,2 mannosyltransferase KTR1 n=1 Tax=Metarhizium album (strain ARSEF 1941) TaxID=1081103 RepID=A0A0B2WIN4_METAS|nr:alpha-1,2 mannosyltransferase KTR1 [Metarhizium album ARSEF 1941]KHN95896.1 alpha-1,2 mannosyltransferase KTR1 [Metarhizium album ARSEF 1941]